MTNIKSNQPTLIEIIDDAALIAQICSLDRSYELACAAISVNLDSATPYDVSYFDKRSRLHRALPGSANAHKDEVVFTSIIPLGLLQNFSERSGLLSLTQ